ncbi:nuclear transport factor 2 family protein [Verticiella sediminum]|uniref:nuclear transport factor 2 family protein n=1 Tax=Verticiella sediminum TaxID=1247510 RepID=UPI0014797B1B|nr:nuclear transport factor 2 family protein [Verticiella sediminum]
MNTEANTARTDLEQAQARVRRYLAALEARDVEAAQRHLAPDVRITGPGGRTWASAQELVANSAGRYRRIGKHITQVDCLRGDESGVIVVYCSGTLHGEWLDGTSFAGVRFIDRFECHAHGITRQDVWNDAAEHRLRQAAPPSR